VRASDGTGEVAMMTYAHFADRDPLTRIVLEQMLAGVSTRRFARTCELVGQEVLDAERPSQGISPHGRRLSETATNELR